MTISLHDPLLVILVIAIIVGVALFRIISSYRHHKRSHAHSHERKVAIRDRIIAKRIDHGARIAKLHGHARSPEWRRVEKEHLLREPACAACGHKGKGLQVHHIKPFHLNPQLELDTNNLITLCEIKGREHHLLLGHLDEWESYNEHIREDVKRFYKKSAAQIRADLEWQKKVLKRPGQLVATKR